MRRARMVILGCSLLAGCGTYVGDRSSEGGDGGEEGVSIESQASALRMMSDPIRFEAGQIKGCPGCDLRVQRRMYEREREPRR